MFPIFFCHSACNQGQRERAGRKLSGALMFLPLLDAFHTYADPCVKFIEDRIREEKKTPRTSTNNEMPL